MKNPVLRLCLGAAIIVGLAASAAAQAAGGATGAGGAQGAGQAGAGQTTQGAGQAPQGAGQGPLGTTTFPTFEVTGGYQWLYADEQTFPFGLNVDGARNFGPLGLVAEVGWAFDREDDLGVDLDVHAWNFGVGPRWTGRGEGRLWPFAQVLVGGVHARTSAEAAGVDIGDSDTWFTLQPGVGATLVGGDGWGIVGQVDYRHVFVDD